MRSSGRGINVDGVRVEGVANRRILREAFREATRQTGVSMKLVMVVAMATGGLLGGGMTLVAVPMLRRWPGPAETFVIIAAIVVVVIAARFAAQRLLWWYYRREIRLAMQRLGYELCLSCGYWLKGLPAEAVCPECGAERRRLQ